MTSIIHRLILLLLVISIGTGLASAQSGTSESAYRPGAITLILSQINFQSSLSNAQGQVNAICDFRFSLYGSLSGADLLAGPVERSAVTVNDGLFSTQLDFGSTAFADGNRWMGTTVRCPSGGGAFTELQPRQLVTAVPYAISAGTAQASNGDFMVNGGLAVSGTGVFGGADSDGALSLHSPDIWMHSDRGDRGDGGRAIVHWISDTLAINFANEFAGGVTINGEKTAAGDGGIRLNGQTGGIQVNGDFEVNSWQTYFNGADLILNANTPERGDGGRALVHDTNDILSINHQGDFAGGVRIESELGVVGPLVVDGYSIQLKGPDFLMNAGGERGDGGRALVHTVGDTLAVNYDGDFAGGVRITDLRTGGIIEENLMTAAQRDDRSLLPFSEGDILCWDTTGRQLALCAQPASPLVVAVADHAGRPLVLGAELVRVVGPVRPGDLLVSSSVAGYAMAWFQIGEGDPPMGTVIGKALEGLAQGTGAVLGMIMLQ